jgi:cytochrome P450
MDLPEHSIHRSAFTPFFCSKGIQRAEPLIKSTAGSFAEAFLSSAPRIDFANDIATPYALAIIMKLLGIPPSVSAEIAQLTRWLFGSSDPDLGRLPRGSGAEAVDVWSDILDRFGFVYSQMMEAQTVAAPNGEKPVFSTLAATGCPIEHDDMISHFMLFCTAGHETTAATAAMGMWQLANRPEVLEDLRSRPEYIPSFVEETIRWATPVLHFVRSATRDYRISGQSICEGDLLYISYLSANFDEEVFESPFYFDHLRTPNRHLSFSVGRHGCLGLTLARSSLIALWKAIIPQIKSLSPAGDLRMSESTFISSPKTVPVSYEVN